MNASRPATSAAGVAPSAPGLRRWNQALWVLALAGLAASLVLWQRLDAIQQQLARQSADNAARALEAQTAARQSQELARDTAARVAVFEARLSEIALQRSQLQELMQSLSRSRDENLVVDIESALRLAQQQAQLTGSIEPLLAALRSAEQRVLRAAQPRLTVLQRALARDIERVRTASVSDMPSLLVKLDELVRLADDLVVANAMPTPPGAGSARATSQPVLPWWRVWLNAVAGELRGLVRVSRIELPEAALLSPEQSFFLRENYKLKLLNARLGLLARQVEPARADLTAARNALGRYFDAASRRTQASDGLLQQVLEQSRQLQLPRIDDTLAALTTAAAGR